MKLRLRDCPAVFLFHAVLFFRLLYHHRFLRKADVVVLFPEGGFGHTITGPDVARRIFRNRRVVLIVLSEFKRHNARVSELWQDIRVIFSPLEFGMRLGGYTLCLPGAQWLKQFAPRFAFELIRRIWNPRADFILGNDELYQRIPIPSDFKSVIETLPARLRWPICYLKLEESVAPPRVGLSSQQVDLFRRNLSQSKDASKATKLCCLYLRQKGAGSHDLTSATRDGSPLKDYVPSIALVVEHGYHVLLIGDVPLKTLTYNPLGEYLVDSECLRVDRDLFSLYAATEAHIFIGESGGGMWLPQINRIPILWLNAFPYGLGVPGASRFFKTVRDKTGRLVDYRELFAEHLYDQEMKGMTIQSNNSNEIKEAVACFLEEITHWDEPDPNAHILETFPDAARIKYAKARLSPAWLKLYEKGSEIR
jgi:putative glycosyltransferase (TIGR04372 family)